jgi:secreted trypsin-like serine protease
MRGCLIGLVIVLTWVHPGPVHAIYGGAVVPATQGKALVKFSWRKGARSGSCSGVLIASRAVLTAAHCVRSPKYGNLRVAKVRIGNPKGKTLKVKVASIHVHPQFKRQRPESGYDIAVLLLKKAVKGRQPMPLARADQDPTQGKRVMAWGFGLTMKRGRTVRSRRLRQAQLWSLSPFGCFSGPVKKMAKTRICAASPRAGVCPGDSGGPITRTLGGVDVVYGLSSVTLNRRSCANSQVIMTRVSAFADWIATVMAKTTRKSGAK